AYAAGIDSPFFRARADYPNRALSVFERLALYGVVVVGCARKAVFENEGMNADAVEPFSDVGALRAPDELLVAASRRDDDRGAGCLSGRGKVDFNRRVVDIADRVDALARLNIGRNGGLLLVHTLESRGSLRPQIDYLRLLRADGRDQHKQTECPDHTGVS